MKQITFCALLFFTTTHSFSQKSPTLEVQSKNTYAICFTKSGKTIAVGDGTSVKLFTTDRGLIIKELRKGHTGQILSLDISRDSSLLVSAGRDSTVIIWDMQTNRPSKKLAYHKSRVRSVAISSDNHYILSGDEDGRVALYDITEEKVIQEFTGQSGAAVSVKFLPNSKYHLSASSNGVIYIFEIGNGKPFKTIESKNGIITDVSISGNGVKMLSVGNSGRIDVRDISDIDDIKVLSDVKTGFEQVTAIDINQDNKTYASATAHGTINIVGRFGSYSTKIGVPVNDILFMPDLKGRLLVAVATEGKGLLLIDGREMKLKEDSSQIRSGIQ